MTTREQLYRGVMHFFMAMASTSLLPAIYFIKCGVELWSLDCEWLSRTLDIVTFIGVPVLVSFLSLLWMWSQSNDSIKQGVIEISPVNHNYLPIYLGYIFVSLSMPTQPSGNIDLITLIVVYLLICLFVTCSKTLCFNPIFILFGYDYYQVKTNNGVIVFVITKQEIRKGDKSPTFPNLRKVNEMVYIEKE